ncbi:MAG: palindromic element RPE4 domain-containing protein [Rickettsia endosymbiont of Pentastiridius leporinus]
MISIFSCFLDTVVKPRYDTKRAFRSTQQDRHGVTSRTFLIYTETTYFFFLKLNYNIVSI